MILETRNVVTNFGSQVTQTFVKVGDRILCHYDSYFQILVLPSEKTDSGYEITSYCEVEDYGLIDKVKDIVNDK